MELKLFIRQLKVYNIYNNAEVHYDGLSPYTLNQVPGPLTAPSRQWPNYPNYNDATGDVDDIFKLKLTWSLNRDSAGSETPGTLAAKKSVSGIVTFEGATYLLLRKWLVDDVSAPLNAVDVKIQDTGCNVFYEGYKIKASDLNWCESGICTYDVTLKQQDEMYACIQKTLITDNWQGWYQTEPANGKKHPRFSYCNEQRPNGMLVMVWWAATVGGIMMLTIIPLLLILNVIFFIINMIIGVINTIIAIVGGTPLSQVNWQTIPYFDFGAMLDAYAQKYIESAGCGREHPASLIRDYITNVCDKCGVEVDAASCPIFFAPSMTFDTSDRGPVTRNNPHYLACLLTATVERGIRRFRSLNTLGIGGQNENTTDYWIDSNNIIWALSDMLDNIKGVYNAEWGIFNGKLYFQRKDYFRNPGYIYDFSEGSPDRSKILEGICYEPNEQKYPATLTGIWSPDASDTCGNEAGNVNGTGQMNDALSLGFTDNNPLFQGVESKAVNLGATKFRLDGASTDYIYDAAQVVVNGSVFTPWSMGNFRDFVMPFIRKYADYALLLENEGATLPKILCWSGESYLNAKCVKTKAAWPGAAPQPEPDINPSYNPTLTPWHVKHPPQTHVIGENLSFATTPPGVYRVKDYFGIVVSDNPAILVNWPMYWATGYYDTLWDYFHWIDDPRKNPKMHRNFRVKIALCCEDILRCKINGDASNSVLADKIKVDQGFFTDGIIKEITASNDPSDTYGRYIELKGEC